jgi:hypothetical protein
MLSSGITCYHLRWNVIIWDAMLSSGANVIIWEKMLSSGANVIMVSSGVNVIICCYHVLLSSGMIKYPFFIFPENFTHSFFLPLFQLYHKRLAKGINVKSFSALNDCFLYFFASFPYKKPFIGKLDKIFHGCPFTVQLKMIVFLPPNTHVVARLQSYCSPRYLKQKKICFYF